MPFGRYRVVARIWRVGALLLCGVASTTVFVTAQSAPTFRSGVRLIEVDVFVTDRDGRFVRGLTPDDFELVEDGKPQEIRAFSVIDLPVDVAAAASAVRADTPEPDVVTNTTPDGRVYVILMDSPSTAGPGGERGGLTYDTFAKTFARQFVEESVSAGDFVAVVHAQGTFTESQTFTTSKRRMIASIDRYGRGLSGDSAGLTGPEMVRRNLDTYRAIEQLSERLGAMSGRRKAIVWVGGQIDFAPQDRPCPSGPDPMQYCAIQASAPALLAAYRDAIGAATRHNVAIYPIDPSGMTTALGMGELKRQAALRMVAEDTGGVAVVGTNNLSAMYQAIVRDNSAYYLLGYTPSVEYRDGRFHDIRVRVKRKDVTVRARKGYFASRSAAAAVERRLPEGVSDAARGALRMPVPVRGLAIDLFSAPFKGVGRDGSVVIGGQVAGQLRLGAGDRITVSYQVFDREGALRAGEYKVFTLNPTPQTHARIEDAGLRFVDRIALPPGAYELRLVADQPNGSLGSIVAPLDVPAFDQALALSGITLAASNTASDVTLHEDATIRTAHGMNPTAIRRFNRGDVLSLFAEVYSNDPRMTADELTVKAIVADPAGVEVKREEATVVRTSDTAAPGRWGFQMEIGLLDVDPGRYVVTVEAMSARRSAPERRTLVVAVED